MTELEVIMNELVYNFEKRIEEAGVNYADSERGRKELTVI